MSDKELSNADWVKRVSIKTGSQEEGGDGIPVPEVTLFEPVD